MKQNKDNLKIIFKELLLLFFLIITFIFTMINKSIQLKDVVSYLGYSITLSSALVFLFDKFLWKYILQFLSSYKLIWPFFEKLETPILEDEYNCIIKYNYNNQKGEKEAEIKIKQTYTSIDVIVITDEIESNTVISEIVNIENQFVLYYIYRTNPKAEFHVNNPPQLGGCRICLDSITEKDANEKLFGKYWTTSQTIGDMEFFIK